jgi:hypothetical protein
MSTTTVGAVTDLYLEPIGLDELVDRAALLTRVDRKYVLPVARARQLLRELPDGTRVLEINGRRELGYRSTYLDTAERTSYTDAGRSRRRRWKVRTRSYLETGTSWLEVKTRVARDQSHKQRVEHAAVSSTSLLSVEGAGFVASALDLPTAATLRPVLTTHYRRATLYLPGTATRATVDVDLAWESLPDRRLLERPGLAVVETKTGATPSEVDRLLWRHGHRPVRMSKYGLGMAALHPDLPPLKWYRALHRHLGV